MEMRETRQKRGEPVGGPSLERTTSDRPEIYLQSTTGRPRFIRVAAGDLLWEGDREPVPTTLRTWVVDRVDETTVRAVDAESGEEQTWERAWVERRLSTGGMSTNLGGVEWVRLREWPHPTGGTYLTVLAHGDNGRTYVRRYRPVDDERRVVELWTDDPEARWLTEAGRATLDHEVATAIAATGVTLREAR